jgi:hypothetical protein
VLKCAKNLGKHKDIMFKELEIILLLMITMEISFRKTIVIEDAS